MFDSAIIEVAIGLIFVFSLLAILVTQINGLISNLLNLRAKQLKESLQELITDPEIQAKVLAHPIINMVHETVRPEERLSAQAAADVTKSDVTHVSSIEPNTFVEALIGILVSASGKTLYNSLMKAIDAMPNSDEKSRLRELLRQLETNFSEQKIRDIRTIIESISDEETQQRLMNGLDMTENALQRLGFKSDALVSLREGIRKIQDKTFQSALETVLTTARSLEEAQTKLERWFNDQMGRASDLFRRRLQWISLGVGMLVAVVLNVDTIHLFQVLWNDPELRAQLVVAANEFQESGAIGDEVVIPDETEGATGDGGTEDDGEVTMEDVEEQAQDIRETLQELLSLDLPIGWVIVPVDDQMVRTAAALAQPDPRWNSRNLDNFVPGRENWWQLWLQKILGLLITGVAAAQGAPFWFDLLNKIATRRTDDTTKRVA